MNCIVKTLFPLLLVFLLFPHIATAEIVKNISAEGSCAIVGMSAEQSQLIALQRARASAIEQAASVSVSSSTLVTNMALTADFIKTYSKGFSTFFKKYSEIADYCEDYILTYEVVDTK